MSAEPTADDCRAALEAAGWATSFRIIFHLRGRAWVARAAKDRKAVEGAGASSAAAWWAVYEHVFEVGRG